MGGDEGSKKFAIVNGSLAGMHTRLYRVGPILQQLKKEDMYDPKVKFKGKRVPSFHKAKKLTIYRVFGIFCMGRS